MPRAIAFYLPQFHPIPENDLWWGKGFTEWSNVTRCKPRFAGHYQPHLPADLGFCDLRLQETRVAQAQLAASYGIHGFCYYHYWFTGRRILEKPFNSVLASREPNFPFCLCWANENWTRRWDGQDLEVLLQQTYSYEDDATHLHSLLPAFHDPRYIRIDNRPLFLIYKISQLPQASRTIETWRKIASQNGLPGLFLCNVESSGSEKRLVSQFGLDAAVEFAPDWDCLPPGIRSHQLWRIPYLLRNLIRLRAFRENYVGSYSDLIKRMLNKTQDSERRFRCVTPMWDNSARRSKNATTLIGAEPKLYEEWLRTIADQLRGSHEPEDEKILFINAWNEWAEGCHLEPCQKWNRAYLESTLRALQ